MLAQVKQWLPHPAVLAVIVALSASLYTVAACSSLQEHPAMPANAQAALEGALEATATFCAVHSAPENRELIEQARASLESHDWTGAAITLRELVQRLEAAGVDVPPEITRYVNLAAALLGVT